MPFTMGLSELSMRDRWVLGIRVICLLLCLGWLTAGHPPAGAQIDRQMPAAPTPVVQAVEDAYQDRDIHQLQLDILKQQKSIDDLTKIVEDQGRDIVGWRAQVNQLLWFISVALTGGVGIQLVRKKKGANP